MYTRLCEVTGWTWEYVDECMTLSRLYAFIRRWKSSPPVAESVAAFVGIKPASTAANDAELGEFIASMPMKIIPRRKKS